MTFRKRRQPSDYLRTRRGVQERRCIACGKWHQQTVANFCYRQSGRGMVWTARCKVCESARQREEYEKRQAGPVEPVKIEPLPPPLEWPTVLRGLV